MNKEEIVYIVKTGECGAGMGVWGVVQGWGTGVWFRMGALRCGAGVGGSESVMCG